MAKPKPADMTSDRARSAIASALRTLEAEGSGVDALAAADAAVTNDSGLMHVSAAIGTPTIAIFGPTSPWHWKPLNPLAAVLEPPGNEHSRERARVEGNDAVRHRRTDDVSVDTVLMTVRQVLAKVKKPPI